jgi:hypothetical protein
MKTRYGKSTDGLDVEARSLPSCRTIEMRHNSRGVCRACPMKGMALADI